MAVVVAKVQLVEQLQPLPQELGTEKTHPLLQDQDS
jgi:hypothetical protein